MFWWIVAALAVMVIAVYVTAYICYRMAFLASSESVSEFPEGEIYEPFHAAMAQWAKETKALPQECVSIKSFDGLTLRGIFYEFAPGAPVELMFHGYRGTAQRDLAGGVQRCFKLGRSCLLVDQRASGESEGKIITFGIHEHKDCLAWVDFLIKKFGPEVTIILTGVSMGAATVLMAAGKPLPENVLGVLADCSYSSPKEIIQKVIGDMGLPKKLSYPFVKLGAKVFGGFDLEEYSPMEAMETCTVPVIFFHGEEDQYVPCRMSRRLYRACRSEKKIVTIPNAGHGLCYPVGGEYYLQSLRDFFGPEASYGEE